MVAANMTLCGDETEIFATRLHGELRTYFTENKARVYQKKSREHYEYCCEKYGPDWYGYNMEWYSPVYKIHLVWEDLDVT